jgi:hypothetical protein
MREKNRGSVTIKNAGHFLQEDKGEELAQVILDFIQKILTCETPQFPSKCRISIRSSYAAQGLSDQEMATQDF